MLRRTRPGLLAAFALALGLAGCAGGQPDPQQAFLQSMVPHHESAVAMAEVAQSEGQARFVTNLAHDVIHSQTEEIGRMQMIHERIFQAPLKPDMHAHDALGLSAAQAGMDHMGGAQMLRGSDSFDRDFVMHMIPHHEGAVRMAETVRTQTDDQELRSLADRIIAAQRREIGEMRRFLADADYEPPSAERPRGSDDHSGHSE